MHWRGEAKATFFGCWTAAGLPDPHTYVRRYERCRETFSAPNLGPARDGPLEASTVDRVYSFGGVVGQALAQALDLSVRDVGAAIGWCGRFNLGISLFDHICDESGRADVLMAIPPFRMLTRATRPAGSGDATPPAPLTATERVLQRLATQLLGELADQIGSIDGAERDPLWDEVVRLYDAEIRRSRLRFPAGRHGHVHSIMQTTAATPFVVMAERIALGGTRRGLARELGAAIGRCVWVVDDAMDLWEDLDAGRWNLFLMHAMDLDPDIPWDHPLRDIRIVQALHRSRVMRATSEAVIADLEGVTDHLPAAPSARSEAIGLIGAALATW